MDLSIMSYYRCDGGDVTAELTSMYHVTVHTWILNSCNRYVGSLVWPEKTYSNSLLPNETSRKLSPTGMNAVPTDGLAPLVMVFGSGMMDKFDPSIYMNDIYLKGQSLKRKSNFDDILRWLPWKWQLPVKPLTKMSSKWLYFRFRDVSFLDFRK